MGPRSGVVFLRPRPVTLNIPNRIFNLYFILEGIVKYDVCHNLFQKSLQNELRGALNFKGDIMSANPKVLTEDEIKAIVETKLKEGQTTRSDYLLSKIVRKFLVESNDKGTGATDLDATTEQKMADTLWEQGYPAFRDVFARRVVLPKGIVTYKFPVPAKNTALESQAYKTDPAVPVNVVHVINTYVAVEADIEVGVCMGWNRSYLDLATWDVLAQHLREAGRMIEYKVFQDCLTELIADADKNDLASVDSYTDFLAGVKAVALKDYNCDTCIINVGNYFDLLNDDKFINTLYTGSTSPIKTGKIETTIGVTVFPTNALTEGQLGDAIFMDSTKALGLAVLRERKVEEYALPKDDEYGFVATMVYGADTVLPEAIAITSPT